MIRRYIAGLFIIILPAASFISASAAQDAVLPGYRGYVNDFAGILGASTVSKIEALCRQLAEKTTAQVALVTVATTKPLTIEEYAVKLFEKWGIGLKGKDNGILILVSVNDRKVRIETGYGLEGALPDAVCSQIIYQVILPAFREGNYDKGLLSATITVAQLISKEYNINLSLSDSEPDITPGQNKNQAGRAVLYLILFIFLFGMRSGLLFFLILGPSGRRRGGYWYGSGYSGSGSSFGGGFGGFGGGFSGGGGASGGW